MKAAHSNRRLLAILVADAVGYSSRMADDDQTTVLELGAARELFASHVAAAGGRIVDTAGDSVLATFSSAIAALHAGVAAQRQLLELSEGDAAAKPLQFRIGIHLGDVIEHADGTIYGDGVNVASRLQSLASPGGIVISESVKSSAVRQVRVAVTDLGEQTLKGMPEPIRVYQIDTAVLSSSRSSQAVQTEQKVFEGAGPLSIVILPFANQSGREDLSYVAQGLTASVATDLSRIRELFVVSPTTAAAYQNKQLTAKQVARELGVRFVLRGGVQSNGPKVRIAAQLADGYSDAHLWSETFEGDAGNLFELQDQVTTRIGNSLGRELVIRAARDIERQGGSATVATLMLRVAALRTQPLTRQSAATMERLCREALAISPDNLQVMATLAPILAMQAGDFHDIPSTDRNVKANEAYALAQKVRAVDPNEPFVYFTIAVVAGLRGDWEEELRAAQTRLRLQPKSPAAHSLVGHLLFMRAKPQEALEVLKRALAFDPVSPSEFLLAHFSGVELMLGHYDAAIEWALEARDANTELLAGDPTAAIAHELKGNHERAGQEAAKVMRAAPTLTALPRPDDPPRPPAFLEYERNTLIPAMLRAGFPP